MARKTIKILDTHIKALLEAERSLKQQLDHQDKTIASLKDADDVWMEDHENQKSQLEEGNREIEKLKLTISNLIKEAAASRTREVKQDVKIKVLIRVVDDLTELLD